MAKHHWRKSIKSFFGVHIDPQKDEELKKSRTEIEDKMQKILKLVGEGDEVENDGEAVETNKKESLFKLIQDFQKHYQLLYTRYDHLTGELRKKVHGKQGKENSSSSSDSSSDSDIDFLPEKKGNRNGKVEHEFQILADSVKQELEMAHLEVADLKRKLTAATEEREALHLDHVAALSKIEDAEKTIGEFNFETQRLRDETSCLAVENGNLKLKLSQMEESLENAHDEAVNLSQKHRATEEENRSLSSKSLELSDEIRQAQNKIHVLIAESKQLRETLGERERDISSHMEMHEVHKHETSTEMRGLKMELDLLFSQKSIIEKQKGDEVSALLKKLEEKEKDSLSQIDDLKTQISTLQQEVESLSDLKGKLEEQMLQKGNEALAQVKDFMDQVCEKQQELDSLKTQKNEYELQLQVKVQDTSEHLIQIDDLKEELANKAADIQRILKEKEIDMVRMKDLTLELDSVCNQKSKLEVKHRSQTLEIVLLQQQKDELWDRNSTIERALTEMESELAALQEKFQDREREASAQIMALASQNNDLLEELSCLKNQTAESELQVGKKTQEISEFLVQIDNLKKQLGYKTADAERLLEQMERQIVDLELEVDCLNKQKLDLEEQIRDRSGECDQLREEQGNLKEKISTLEKTLAERGQELLSVQKIYEDSENEASIHISAFTEQISQLQQELDVLRVEKKQLELQFEGGKQESSESLALLENQNIDLANKINEKERMLKEHEHGFNKLEKEHKQLDAQFQECKENLQLAERKIREMSLEFRTTIQAKDQIVDDLEEIIEELKRDLEMKGDEIGTLVENVSTNEVKLRLSNQKLRVTEQLLTENEENHIRKEEKYLEVHRLLEDRISVLLGSVNIYKEAQFRMMSYISEQINETLTGMDSLAMKFEEDYGHFETCIYEILNELRVAKSWVDEANGTKVQLKNEVANLAAELQEKSEQEVILKRKVAESEAQIEELQKRLKEGDGEKESLVRNIKRLEKKMEELGTMIDEKDKGFVGLGEEKREAIRQLCIWIDYHRSRCDYLKAMLSRTTRTTTTTATTGGRRQITT